MRYDGTRRRGLYRSRKKSICGVCGGIAEYFDFSVFWVQVAFVVLAFMSGFWPVVFAYIILAMIMKPSPVKPVESEDERDFYESYMRSRGYALERIKHQFEQLERRIRRMEDVVTNKAYDWDRKFRQ